MKKVCFVIGGKDYSNPRLRTLPGCEADAHTLFQILTDLSYGEYDKKISYLLISPTLNEVQSVFDSIIANNPDIDVFTFAYSGHGSVKAGSMYLCMRDTGPERLSTTALPLSHIFLFLNEAAPREANIIIDACESGGVVCDLNQLIKPDLLGASNTPGVNILASAASDQSAGETLKGGYALTALVKCLRGDHRVQSSRPHLNLVEVGRSVSAMVSKTQIDQTPVVWGLNLLGESFFAKKSTF